MEFWLFCFRAFRRDVDEVAAHYNMKRIADGVRFAVLVDEVASKERGMVLDTLRAIQFRHPQPATRNPQSAII